MLEHDECGIRDECGACELGVGRRVFFKEAATAAAALFLTLGARKAEAAQMVVGWGRGMALGAGVQVYPMPQQDGAMIDRENEAIVMRFQGKVYAFALSCPHQHTALKWLQKDGRFQCPKHKSKYRPDGTFISGRATRGMDRYAVRVVNGQVQVDMEHMYRQDQDPQGWAQAFATI